MDRFVCYTHVSGIYYHCKQNEYLKELFEKSKTATWCIHNTVKSDFGETVNNEDRIKYGYIIYNSDHKITIKDILS